jgi:hypothetical protein
VGVVESLQAAARSAAAMNATFMELRMMSLPVRGGIVAAAKGDSPTGT